MHMTYDRDASPGYLTNWAARLFARALDRRLGGSGSGPMPVFFALQDGGTLTQKQLAQMAGVEQPTMANTLARMERDGLIVRRPDPEDGRCALVSLTAAGLKQAARSFSAAKALNAVSLADLSPTEREQFLELLHRIVAALERDLA